MVDFIDTCVAIGYFNEYDSLHEKAKSFIESRTESLLITNRVNYEIHRTIKDKVNRAIIIVLRSFYSDSLENELLKNEQIVRNRFNKLKSENPRIENFIGYLEKVLIELLKRQTGDCDITILVEWASEIDTIIAANIEKIVGKRSSFPGIESETDDEKRAEIRKVIAEIKFNDEFDEAIFLELAVLVSKMQLIDFYTFDEPFFRKGKIAIGLLITQSNMAEGKFDFHNLN